MRLSPVLAFSALLALGCAVGESVDTGSDTNRGYFFWIGAVSAPDGVFEEGLFGVGVFGSKDADWVCQDIGEMSQTDVSITPCNGCDFAYHVSIANSAPEGSWCSGLGLTDSGHFDGMSFGIGWGTDSYTYHTPYYDYVFDDPIYLYYEDSGWFVFGYSYDGNGYSYISDDYAQFMRPYTVYYNGYNYWLTSAYPRE